MPFNWLWKHKYSVNDIDRMRIAVNDIFGYRSMNDPFVNYKRADIEDMLRTYMSNGTSVEELEAVADTERKIYKALNEKTISGSSK